MPFFDGVTVVLLQAPWTSQLKTEAEFLPEASVEPFLEAFTRNWRARLITRQLSTVEDFRYWCSSVGKAHLGTTLLWLAAHGEQVRQQPPRAVLTLPPVKRAVRLTPEEIRAGLACCGPTNGVIVDSCFFGANEPKEWLPSNVSWALANLGRVDWTASLYFALRVVERLLDHKKGPPSSGAEAHRRFAWWASRVGLLDAERITSQQGHGPRLARFFWRDHGWRSLPVLIPGA